MEKRKTKKQLAEENQKRIDSYDYLSNAASTMDCTGLIPSAPKNAAELESYEEVYHYLPPEVKSEAKKKDE